MLYLPFFEGSGDHVSDESIHGNHGILDLPSWIDGKFGPCLRFDGDDDHVDLGDPTDGSLDFGTGDFTLTAWIYPEKYTETMVIAKWGSGTENGYRLYVRTSMRFMIGTGTVLKECAGGTVLTDTWQFVVGIRKGTKIYVYMDNVELDTEDVLSTDDVSNVRTVYVGRRHHANGLFFKGKIADVRAYSRALEPHEMLALYRATV